MSSTEQTGEVPEAVATVTRRYHRLERLFSGALSLLAAVIVAGSLLFFPLLLGLVVAVVTVAALRMPLLRSSGTVHAVSSANPATVREEFESVIPPALALQWGVADEIRPSNTGAVYDFSYLFGLRSVQMETEVQSTQASETESDTDVTLSVTVADEPWGTYDVDIDGRDTETHVTIDWQSDRRFGLRQLPQWLVAERYRDDVLASQGYTIRDRDASLSL